MENDFREGGREGFQFLLGGRVWILNFREGGPGGRLFRIDNPRLLEGGEAPEGVRKFILDLASWNESDNAERF